MLADEQAESDILPFGTADGFERAHADFNAAAVLADVNGIRCVGSACDGALDEVLGGFARLFN